MTGRIFSTMWGLGPEVHLIDRREHGSLRVLFLLLQQARAGDVVLVSGAMGKAARYADQLTAIALRLLRPGVALVVTDATWHPRSTPGEAHRPYVAHVVAFWAKLLLRLMNGRRTHFCFLSRSECAAVVGEARVDAARVHFMPFTTTIWDPADRSRLQALAENDEGYIFSGGNASRDYELLMAAAELVPIPMRVATTRSVKRRPAHVTLGSVPPNQFMEVMAKSAAVVLPLAATSRSAGQQTYLNAMLLGKPVVITDTPGVRDHVTHGFDAIVVPSTPQAIARGLRWVTDPANAPEVDTLRRRARQRAEQLSPEAYARDLMGLARAVMAATPVRNPSFT